MAEIVGLLPPNLNTEAWTTAKVAKAPLAVMSPLTGAPNKGAGPEVQGMAEERPPVGPCSREIHALELDLAGPPLIHSHFFMSLVALMLIISMWCWGMYE